MLLICHLTPSRTIFGHRSNQESQNPVSLYDSIKPQFCDCDDWRRQKAESCCSPTHGAATYHSHVRLQATATKGSLATNFLHLKRAGPLGSWISPETVAAMQALWSLVLCRRCPAWTWLNNCRSTGMHAKRKFAKYRILCFWTHELGIVYSVSFFFIVWCC